MSILEAVRYADTLLRVEAFALRDDAFSPVVCLREAVPTRSGKSLKLTFDDTVRYATLDACAEFVDRHGALKCADTTLYW